MEMRRNRGLSDLAAICDHQLALFSRGTTIWRVSRSLLNGITKQPELPDQARRVLNPDREAG